MVSKKEWKVKIQSMIKNASDLELEKIWIPHIMSNQTHKEVDDEQTELNNGIGLTGADAPFMTSIYKDVCDGMHLTPLRASAVRKCLKKYWAQYHKKMNTPKVFEINGK